MVFLPHRGPAERPRQLLRLSVVGAAMCLLPLAHASAARDDEHSATAHQAVTPAAARRSAADKAAAVKTISAATAAAAAADLGHPVPRAKARDPMDIIRERLAARLGAASVRAPATTAEVKVVSKDPGAAREPVAAKSTSTRVAALAPGLADGAIGALHGGGMNPRGAGAAHPVGAAPWRYEGDSGPAAWAQLKPEYAACGSGLRQSPIDIRDGIKVELDAVQFDYRPSGFRVIDNGHTVQVNVAAGNTIEVTGKRYELVQFHFHRPSEERIDGKPFDMVAHLVHKSVEGRLAVVAVLLDRGSAQPIVQMVWNNLPLEKGDEVAARAPLDLNALLPTDRRYYTYMGSLSEPPCTEGVLWMVMKTAVEVSPEQIAIFSRLYPMNARPIQSVSGRLIKESN
jgi:carbonic anhydrase